MGRERVIEMFPKALGVYRWDNTDGHKQLKETVREKMKTKEIDGSPVSKDIFHFWNKSGENFLDEDAPIIKDFEKFLGESYLDFMRGVQKWDVVDEYIITDCWVNVTRQGGWQYKHSHANCFISGTYYLNFPVGATGITFHAQTKEKSDPYLALNPKDICQFNSESLTMMPEEGILFLWPSQLTHECKILTTDVRRVSISMNFVPAELDTGIYRLRLSR
jgi:uncharacterized protein (TIGR02466 family)|tara:strand:+ start:1426 stop:2082 length:657 start_codon:yes stop_codon:yes gene_type:complete